MPRQGGIDGKCSEGGLVLAAAWVLGAAGESGARGPRVGQIPNGGVAGCASCHIGSAGGGPRNAFGQQVEANFLTATGFSGRVQWGPELAAQDADGDGFTNGQELGDPEGLWKAGDADPSEVASITLPGDAKSHPEPPVASAVEATTWGQVKEAVRDLFR